MSKNKKTRIQEKTKRQGKGFINVPTYLFPQGEEYSEEIVSEPIVDVDKKILEQKNDKRS